MNFYLKVYISFLLPITIGLVFTIFSINSLLEEQQKLIHQQEQNEIDHIQQRFNKILEQMSHDINIISKSNEIENALLINDTNTLSQWGAHFLNYHYSTILFANKNNTIVSRASDPFKFGDKLDTKLLERISDANNIKGIHVIDNKEVLFHSKKLTNYSNETIGTIIIGKTIDDTLLKDISNNKNYMIRYKTLDKNEIVADDNSHIIEEIFLNTQLHQRYNSLFVLQLFDNEEIEELKSFKFNILSFTILMTVIIIAVLYFILTNFLRPYKKIYLLLLDFVNNRIDFNHLKNASKNISRTTKTKEIQHMSRAIYKVSKKALKNEDELKRISYTDQLTKILNRRKLDEILLKESYEANRYDKKLSIIIIDIDHFKKINDTHGHPTGDKILKQFSNRITTNLRTSDFFGRWGGEEFLVICPSTDMKGAEALAEKLQSIVKTKPFVNDIAVSASFGIGEILKDESFYNLISRTDEALYKAKNQGRDRIEKASQTHIDNNPTQHVE